MRLVMAEIRSAPKAGHVVKSTKCCGRSPSGPPDVPAGKDLIALVMSASVTSIEPNCIGSGGMEKSEGTGGWRCFRASSVTASSAAGFSSEHKTSL